MITNGHYNINTNQYAAHHTNVHVKSQNSSHPIALLVATTVQVVTPLATTFVTCRNKISAVYVYVKRK